MLSMDGLEMIAVLVVMGLFIKVLEQFGMFEPVGGEGKGPFSPGFVCQNGVMVWLKLSLKAVWTYESACSSHSPLGPERAAVPSVGLGY